MAYHYKQDFPIFQHTDVAYIDNAATATSARSVCSMQWRISTAATTQTLCAACIR